MRCVHVYRLALSSTPSLVILFFYRNKKQLLKKCVTRILHSSTVCGCTHHLGASTGTGGSTEPTYERASVSDNSVSSPSPSSHSNFVFLSTPEHTDGGAPPPKKRTQKGRSTLSASPLSLSLVSMTHPALRRDGAPIIFLSRSHSISIDFLQTAIRLHSDN